jgi:hypothetical protein
MNLDHDMNQDSLACAASRNDLWSSLAVCDMPISRDATDLFYRSYKEDVLRRESGVVHVIETCSIVHVSTVRGSSGSCKYTEK